MSRRHHPGRRIVLAAVVVLLATLAPHATPVAARDDVVAITADDLPKQAGEANEFAPVRKVTPADITVGTSGGGATPDLGRERVEPPADVKPDEATDVHSLRDEYTSVTANADGTFTATITGERQSYQDEAGEWQPIDTTLVADDTDGFTHRVKANDRVVRIDTSPADGVVARLEADGHRVSLIDPAATRGVLDAITGEVVFGEIDGLILAPTPEGIEFSYRLDTRDSPRQHELRLETDDMIASVGKDGQTIELRDGTGAVALLVTAPRTVDAVGAVADPAQTIVSIGDDDPVDPSPSPTPTPDPTPIPTETPSPSPSIEPSPTPDASTDVTAAPSASVEPGPSATAEGTAPTPSDDVLASPDATVPPASNEPSDAPAASPAPDPPSPTPEPTPAPTPEASETPTPSPSSPAPADGAVTLRYAIADAWLDDPARVYPVLLDPTIVTGTGSGAYDCDVVGNADAWDDWVGQANDPLCSSYMAIGTDDDATNFAIQRGLFWFKGASLGSGTWADDGQQITSATFGLYKDEGSARALQTTLITGTGWSSPADWDDQQGQGGNDSIKYLCANGTSKDCTAGGALYTGSATTPSGDGWVNQDVTTLVRRWYTKRSEDWLPSLGFMTRFVTENQTENVFHNGRFPATNQRPTLTIDFVAPHVAFEFDTSTLGATFAPSTMVTGGTATLPVRIRNVGSSLTFNKWVSGSTDYWFLGYRWFDAKGKLVKISGFTPSGVANFDADVLAWGYSSYRPLPVVAPPTAGQYTLRLDLGHDIAGSRLWASDWVKASKYYSRDKSPNTTPADVRWVGSSIVERAEFGVAVVSGQGSAVGETKTIDLADGTTVGINLNDTASGGARLTSATDSNGTTARHTDYIYDALGRATQATTYQGTGTGTPKLRTTTTYDAGGAPTDDLYSEYAGGSWPITDEYAYAYDLTGRMSDLTRTSDTPDSLLTHATYNADDTVATRTDVLGTAGSASFGYDRLGRLTSATSPLYTGTATYGWRLDGLPASRAWPANGGALTGAFSYDAAKRPISLGVTRNSVTIATFDRAYDRLGHVTSESQTLTGVTGAAGSGTQTFTYDAMGRITASTGITGKERAYSYDASSNRLTETEGTGGSAVTTTYTYDRTDELKTRKVGTGSAQTVSYDVYGNLVTLPAESGTGSTAFSYDLADHLLGLDGPTEPAVTFTIDALGRSRTRQVTGSGAETLFYLGTSDAVVRIGGGTTPVDAALDPVGVRLATSQGAGPSFFVPDLHGNAAALWGQASAAFVDARRYDPYGETLDHYPASPTVRTPWRFGGRLVEGEATDAEAYDFGFRSYLADIGSFGSIDDVAGQATRFTPAT